MKKDIREKNVDLIRRSFFKLKYAPNMDIYWSEEKAKTFVLDMPELRKNEKSRFALPMFIDPELSSSSTAKTSRKYLKAGRQLWVLRTRNRSKLQFDNHEWDKDELY
jgi:hypothetical protein